MDQKKPIMIFSIVISVLFLLSLFSGCSVPGITHSPPLDVTVHSAYRTTAIGAELPRPGTVFVVVNMTVENQGGSTYQFDNTSAVITNGRMIIEGRFAKITGHGYWGPIPPHAQRTGEIIFGASADTTDFTITFISNDGKDSFDKYVGSIPLQSGSPMPGSLMPGSSVPASAPASQGPGVGGEGAGGTGATGPINVTVNSAYTTTDIQGSRPYAGKMFVVVNMTIGNLGETNYTFSEQGVSITGGGPLTQKLYTVLRNPFVWGEIPAHEAKTGEVVFSVVNSTQQFNVTFLDENRHVILTKDLGTVSSRG